jgi:hypothetical protein
MQTSESCLSDKTIKRRLLKYFRYHNIPYTQVEGVIYMGSAVVRVVNGSLVGSFPQMFRDYGFIVFININFEDCYNCYLRFSRQHNRLVAAYPLIVRHYLPDLFD